MLLAVGLFLCLLPLIARTLILRRPQKGQLATLAPLDTCLYRGVPTSLGLISVVGAVLISRRGGSLPAIIALLIAALWWWALFVLLARRPDRQSMHQPTPSDPGLRPGWLDAAQSVPLLVWPLVLVMLLLFGGLPGSIAGQFALSDNVATSTTTIAARSADSSTTTVTSATDDSVAEQSEPTDPPAPAGTETSTTTTEANVGLFWIVLSDGSQYPVWGLLDDTDSVAYVLMASPRAEGCLLIQYAGNDVDE